MIRRRSSSTNLRPHWLQRFALMLFGCTHVLTASLLVQPTSAFGQDERASAAMTEIWMDGGGLVLTRQIPQELRTDGDSDDDVARTMVEIARQRYRAGDQASATWLVQWARHLSNGRIGSNGFAEFRLDDTDSTFGEVSAAGDVPLKPLADQLDLRPARSEFHVSSSPVSRLELATDVIEQPASPADRGVPAVEVEPVLSGETRRPDLSLNSNSLLGGSALETQRRQGQNRPPQLELRDVGESEIVLGQNVQLIDVRRRQVAVVIPDRGHIGFANQVNRQSPAESTVEPIAIAAISFVSGTVFCAVLCTVLLLVPVRLTIQSRAESRFRARGTTLAADTSAETSSATSVSGNSHAPKPVFKTVREQDKANLVVEEFYRHNVGLFKQLHDQAIPPVKDAQDSYLVHIGAVHG